MTDGDPGRNESADDTEGSHAGGLVGAGTLPNRASAHPKPHVTVKAGKTSFEYRIRVSGGIEKGPRADKGDRILDSNAVRGTVGGEDVDDFRYAGAIAFDEVDGPLTVTLDIDH